MSDINITPEFIIELKAVKTPQELLELVKSRGSNISEENARKWFIKLKSGEIANKFGIPFANGDCDPTPIVCPKCGSSNYHQRYIEISFTDGFVVCWCDDCHYTTTYS